MYFWAAWKLETEGNHLVDISDTKLPPDSILQAQQGKAQIALALISLPLAWTDPLRKNPLLNASKVEAGPLTACTYICVSGHKHHKKNPREWSFAVGRARPLNRISVQLQWIKGVYTPLHGKKVLTLRNLSWRGIFHYRREIWVHEDWSTVFILIQHDVESSLLYVRIRDS